MVGGVDSGSKEYDIVLPCFEEQLRRSGKLFRGMTVTSGSHETMGTAKAIANKALNIFALYNLVHDSLQNMRMSHIKPFASHSQLPFAPLEVKNGKKALSKEGNL